MSRLSRAMRSLFKNPEFFFGKLGLSWLFWSTEYAGGRLSRIDDWTLFEECRALMDPPFVGAGEAAHMLDDDMVLGLEFAGEARAYPWWIMDNHHVANDSVLGCPVLIMLCEACSTGIALDPVIDNRRLTFQLGHYYNGVPSLEDHQTRSVWSPYLTMAIRGPMKGKTLHSLPLVQMEWQAWRVLHPDTRVLPRHLGSRTGHGSDHSIGSPHVPEDIRKTAARWDTRLPHNTLIVGVVTPAGERAYPLLDLERRGSVVNDEVGGIPVVVFSDLSKGSYAALAFSRVIEGRILTFVPSHREAMDRETGSLWNLEGRAVAGPLAGKALSFVPSHVSEWYVWPAHFPNIEIAQ